MPEPAAWSKLAERLARDDIDLLLQNAGVLLADSLEDVDLDTVRAQIELNAIAPLFLAYALAQCLHGRESRPYQQSYGLHRRQQLR